eukprot:Amastigsp_a510612_102.p3 type:complete len:111 gc:universal Amastigsp_a510612_102:347-679(+)
MGASLIFFSLASRALSSLLFCTRCGGTSNSGGGGSEKSSSGTTKRSEWMRKFGGGRSNGFVDAKGSTASWMSGMSWRNCPKKFVTSSLCLRPTLCARRTDAEPCVRKMSQ